MITYRLGPSRKWLPEPGIYKVVLTTDDADFGGFDRVDREVIAFSYPNPDKDGVVRHYIKVYNINRAALYFNCASGSIGVAMQLRVTAKIT